MILKYTLYFVYHVVSGLALPLVYKPDHILYYNSSMYCYVHGHISPDGNSIEIEKINVVLTFLISTPSQDSSTLIVRFTVQFIMYLSDPVIIDTHYFRLYTQYILNA